jgi:hypothetical protein
VRPSRRARRAQYTRTAAVGGAALGVLVALIIIVKGPGGTSLPARSVTAKVLSTTVNARSGAGAALRELQDGDTVRENAVIETDAAGLGEFKYADGSVLRVGPSSEVSLTRARTNGKRRQIASRLVSGKSWHHVAKKGGGNQYAVSVLGATGDVKGTSFAVECEVENDCTYTLVSGRLHVKDVADHDADLRDGDQVEVKFGRLEPVRHLSDVELGSNAWVAQNISLDGGTAPPTTEESTTTSVDDTTTSTAPGDTTTTVAGQVTVTTRTGTVTTRASGGPSPTPPPPTSPPPATTTTRPPTTSTTAPPPSTTSTTKCHRNAQGQLVCR